MLVGPVYEAYAGIARENKQTLPAAIAGGTPYGVCCYEFTNGASPIIRQRNRQWKGIWMATFLEQRLRTGVGPVHVNRFRTRIKPRAGMTLPSGADLANKMVSFMNPDTATVHADRRRWNSAPTLVFRGVARVRPFIALAGLPPIPVPLPQGLEKIGVPRIVRDWMIPDIHTDTVGIANLSKHAFTVQTLRRQFETVDDRRIRTAIQYILVPELAGLIGGLFAKISALVFADQISKPLADYAIMINQYHFLAGRRSFRIGTAAEFGEKGAGWIFETAAVERYSHEAFRKMTETAMGGANAAVTPVWTQMGARVANTYGTMIGSVEAHHTEIGNVGAVAGNALYRSIATHHAALLP
jgi:hypothetical protein